MLLEEKSRENVEISKKKGNLESSIAATQARLAKVRLLFFKTLNYFSFEFLFTF